MPRNSVLLIATLCAVLTMLATCGGCVRSLGPDARSPDDVRALTVQVSIVCDNFPPGAEAWGSGVVVGPNMVLTAAHVVDCTLKHPLTGAVLSGGKPTRILASQPDKIGRRLRLIVADTSRDLARLRIADDGEFYGFAPFETARARPGDAVCVSIGVPKRDVRCGVVDERFTTAEGHDLYLNIPAEQGNSGSGVYDRRGRVVGIITQRRQMANGQAVGGIATSVKP